MQSLVIETCSETDSLVTSFSEIFHHQKNYLVLINSTFLVFCDQLVSISPKASVAHSEEVILFRHLKVHLGAKNGFHFLNFNIRKIETFTVSSCTITILHSADLNPPFISALIYYYYFFPRGPHKDPWVVLENRTLEDSLIHIVGRYEVLQR